MAKKIPSELAIGIILMLAIIIGGFFWLLGKQSEVPMQDDSTQNPRPCTLETKLCPDGSAVSRKELNCEFAECPKQNIFENRDIEAGNCNEKIKICDDGIVVGLIGADCNFMACPEKDIKINKNIVFDDCGNIKKYEKNNWYGDFVSLINNIYRQSNNEKLYSSRSDILDSGKITPEYISDACLSLDNKYFMAIVGGDYGGLGFKLLWYDTEESKITIAKREDIHGGKNTNWFKIQDKKRPELERKEQYWWFVTPNKFGKRINDKIIMNGKSGDGGCAGEDEFEYSIKNNYIKILKSCNRCIDNNDNWKNWNCTYYN